MHRHSYREFPTGETLRYRTAAPPAPGGAQKKGGSSQQQVKPRSFLVGTQNVLEGGDYDQTLTNQLTGGSFTPWSLQATGWLAELLFYVTYTGTHASSPTFQLTDRGIFSATSNWTTLTTKRFSVRSMVTCGI